MILVLGYWVLGNILRYWIVLLLGDIFCCVTQYYTDKTAVCIIHMAVNDYLVPLLTCTLTAAIICLQSGHCADRLLFIKHNHHHQSFQIVCGTVLCIFNFTSDQYIAIVMRR